MMPTAVHAGMFVAALAQAEACGVLIHDGRLELRARYEPSAELDVMFRLEREAIVGVLGWAVPLECPRKQTGPRFVAVIWPTQGMGVVGAWGRN